MCGCIGRKNNQINFTKSGHYAIPISPYKNVLNNIATGNNTNITLVAMESNKSKIGMARKLQRQFTHPPMERLIQLLNAAGEPWKDGSGLRSLAKKVK